MAGGPCNGWVSYRWHHNHRFLDACPLGPSVESSVPEFAFFLPRYKLARALPSGIHLNGDCRSFTD